MADAPADPYTLTPVDQDPFTPPPPVSLIPVDHDPFQDAITYANNLPPVGSPQDQSTHWATQSGMPYGGREMAADPTVPMAARVISAVPIALGDQVSNLASTAWNAATLPGDVALGKTDPMSPDAIARSTNLAGLMQSGGEGGVNTTASGWSPAAKSYLDKATDEVLSPGKVDVEQAMSVMALGGGPESAAKAMQGVDEDNIGHTLLKQAQNLHDTENDGVKAATQFGWNQPSANYLGNELAKATDQEDHASVNKLGKLINSGPQSVSGMDPDTGPYSLDPVMDQHINNLVGLKDPSTKGPLTTLATNRGWNSDAVDYLNNAFNKDPNDLAGKSILTNFAEWGPDKLVDDAANESHPYFGNDIASTHADNIMALQNPTMYGHLGESPSIPSAMSSTNTWNPKAQQYLWDQQEKQPSFEGVSKIQSLLDNGPQGLATMLSSDHPYATDPFVLDHAEKAVNLHNAETNPQQGWHPSVVDQYTKLANDHVDSGNISYTAQIHDALAAGPNAPKLPSNIYQNQMNAMHNTQMGVYPSSKTIPITTGAPLPKTPYTLSPPPTPRADSFVGPTLPHNPNNLDLSEEARNARAREQGYNPDQVFYHGVNDPLEQSSRFQARNQSFADPRTKGEKGLFLATDPRIANQYTGENQAQPRGQVLPLLSSAKNIKTIDWPTVTDTGDYSGEHMRDQINKAIADGYDALHIKNMYDIGGKQEQFVAFNPNQIRSKFAVFDPKYAQSANLLSAKGNPTLDILDSERKVLTPVDHNPFASEAQNGIMPLQGGANMDFDKIRQGLDPQWQNAPIIDQQGNTLHPGNPDPTQEHNYATMIDSKGNPQQGFVAYHGSPYDFDKFNINKVNTGEGSQDEGHGLYFSKEPEIAKWYQSELEGGRGSFNFPQSDGSIKTIPYDPLQKYDDNSVRKYMRENYADKWDQEMPKDFGRWTRPFDGIEAIAHEGSVDKNFESETKKLANPDYARGIPDEFGYNSNQQIARVSAATSQFMKNHGITFTPENNSKIYQVHIAADPDKFADWGKSIQEQPKIQSVLQQNGIEHSPEDTFGDVMLNIDESGSNPQESKDFSKLLNKNGVLGLHYPTDAELEQKPDLPKSKNYVLYHHKPITILNKHNIGDVPISDDQQYTPVDHDPFASEGQNATMPPQGGANMDFDKIRQGLDPQWQNAPIIDAQGNTLHPGNPDSQQEYNLTTMIDNEGNPKQGFVAYHASPSNFDKFDISKSLQGGASSVLSKSRLNSELNSIHFANSPEVTNDYAGHMAEPYIYKTHIAEDPNKFLYPNTPVSNHDPETFPYFNKLGISPNKPGLGGLVFWKGNGAKVTQLLKDSGFRGVHHNDNDFSVLHDDNLTILDKSKFTPVDNDPFQ